MIQDTRKTNSESVERLLGELADDYSQRLDAGEAPAVEEYATAHPELAEVIREIFPALAAMRSRPSDRPLSWESADASAAHAPECLGDYRIIGEIGRGGMGVVYEAQQKSLGRRVALKVLPFAAVLDSRQLNRFKNEAHAAANLHHANIVPVFALGCERGVYYYAMQFIEGRPLSGVIHELQQRCGRIADDMAASTAQSRASSAPDLLGDEGRRFDGSSHLTCSITDNYDASGSETGARRQFYRAVADLGIQAAEGLHYAHEHGVVHRDVKPSNLLLTPDGHLWITDFGLALMQAQPNLTTPGDLLGTVRYMSPEQALAKRVPLDHRTDVYSLGATLYELLSLRPAFDGTDRQELLRQIAFDDPRPLRRIEPSVPHELETIVGKAMAKRPDDRYATAQELADDLRRFVEDKPIHAKPPTLVDRAFKWSRRHRSVMVSSAASLVLAVVGLAVSTVLVIHQRDVAREQYQRAETNLQIARGNVDRMLRWIETQEVSQSPDPGHLRADLLEDSLAFYQSLLPEKRQDAPTLAEAARVYIQVGRIKSLMGDEEASDKAYREGVEIFERLAAGAPADPTYAEKLATGHLDMAVSRWEARQFDKAAEAVKQALVLYERLSSNAQAAPDCREGWARALNMSGLIARDRGLLADAEYVFERAIAVQQEVIKYCPQEPRHRTELARMYRNLADVQLKADRQPRARETVLLAFSIQRDLAASYWSDAFYSDELCRTQQWWNEAVGLATGMPIVPDMPLQSVEGVNTRPQGVRSSPAVLANSWAMLSDMLRRGGKGDESTAAYRQSAAAQEKLAAEHPESVDYRRRLADLHAQHGRNMIYAWRIDDAEQAYQAALEVQAALSLENPGEESYRKKMQEALGYLRSVRLRRPVAELIVPSKESPEGVRAAVKKALGLDASLFKGEPILQCIYADYLLLANRPERAVPVLRQAIDAGGGTACYHKSLALALLACGESAEAKSELDKALVQWKEAGEPPLGPDEWTAAYFADRITQDQFVRRWQNRAMCVGHLGCLPWFYVGWRMELEGKPHDARAAYEKAVQAGRVPNPHLTANWAAYRLSLLNAASRPAPQSN